MKNPLQTFKRITTRTENGNTLIDSAEIVIKGAPDRKLYDISKINDSWTVKSYDNKGSYELIETTETDKTIARFIETLDKKFSEGRVLSKSIKDGWYTYRACENIFRRKLTRQQVSNVLRYERDGTPSSTHSKAVAQANPSLLEDTEVFDDYAIDTWMKSEKKRGYFYSTFNPTTKKHLDKLVFKY